MQCRSPYSGFVIVNKRQLFSDSVLAGIRWFSIGTKLSFLHDWNHILLHLLRLPTDAMLDISAYYKFYYMFQVQFQRKFFFADSYYPVWLSAEVQTCVATPAMRQALAAPLPTPTTGTIVAGTPLFPLSYYGYFSRRHRTKESSLILTLILKSLFLRTNILYRNLHEGGFLSGDETASLVPISITREV